MLTLDNVRSTWVEINLDNLAHNIREVKKSTNEDTLITAVVKANAYGHGAIASSKVFLENGGDRLAVATLSEAIEIRRAGIDVPILILAFTPISQYREIIEYDIIQTIYNYSEAIILSKYAVEMAKSVKIHIKIDTGMGRVGYLPSEEAIEEIIKISKLPNIEIEGIFTHFATADEVDKSFTNLQYNRFVDVINKLEDRGLNIPIKHAANSAAIIDLPEYNLNMVRAGIMLYGLYPSPYVDKSRIKLKPAMTLKTRISNIKTVPKGYGISYGQIFATEKESKIATIPIGYADGFTRLLTSRGEAFTNGKIVPIVGRICMDQSMLDITEIENASVGDEVILFGSGEKGLHIDEVANKLNTINYEIVCMVGRRVPRVYLKNGEIVGIMDYILE
ncbi:MAG: alanine racemase [Tissierellia bacterium]|nr:alanine racemase [Tissierellia bacterium]